MSIWIKNGTICLSPNGKPYVFSPACCCPDGTYWNGIECVTDPPPQDCLLCEMWSEIYQMCIPDPEAHLIHPECDECTEIVCPEGEHWNPIQCICQPDCPTPEICPDDQIWNSAVCQCVPKCAWRPCALNYVWNSITCKCEYVEPPPPPEDPCPDGYYWNGVACELIEDPECPSGYHWNWNINQCAPDCPATVCTPGNHWDPLLCSCQPDCVQSAPCNAFEKWSAEVCKCIPKDTPQECAPGYHWDATVGRCIACTPQVLASKVTSASDPVFDLTPYQGSGIGPPTALARWRIIEVAYPVVYSGGSVDSAGKLVGLPSNFTSTYAYQGFMELQIGCRESGSTDIIWP